MSDIPCEARMDDGEDFVISPEKNYIRNDSFDEDSYDEDSCEEYEVTKGGLCAVWGDTVDPSADASDWHVLVKILIKRLREIKDVEIAEIGVNIRGSVVVSKMADVLSLIFHIGTECVNFSDEQKEEIGTLLAKVIEPIKLQVRKATYLYASLNPFLLQFRSALQFLIEYYKKFPSGDTTLSCIFEQANLQKEIDVLDENIRIFHDYPTDSTVDFKIFGGDSVPDTHKWWPKEDPFKLVAFMNNDPENPLHCSL